MRTEASKTLVELLAPRSIGLMGHLVADEPSPATAREIIGIMVANGALVIEVQIPFSEPIADGPVIMAANHRALAHGVNFESAIALIAEVSAAYPQVSFVVMSYLNVVFRRGYQRFVDEVKAAGARGVIIPDFPIEYSLEFDQACEQAGLARVQVIPPNCDDERVNQLLSAPASQSLVYAVARSGVTGQKTDLNLGVKELVARIRHRAPTAPVAVGFGISSGADVQFLRGIADLAVIGSQTLRAVEGGGIPAVSALWQDLSRGAAV